MLHRITHSGYDVPLPWPDNYDHDNDPSWLNHKDRLSWLMPRRLAIKEYVSRVTPANVCRYCGVSGISAGSWCEACDKPSQRWREKQLTVDKLVCWICDEWKPKFSGIFHSSKEPEWVCCEDCFVLITQDFKKGGATFPELPELSIIHAKDRVLELYPENKYTLVETGSEFTKVYRKDKNYYDHPCRGCGKIRKINGWSYCQKCWEADRYLRICTRCGNYDMKNTIVYENIFKQAMTTDEYEYSLIKIFISHWNEKPNIHKMPTDQKKAILSKFSARRKFQEGITMIKEDLCPSCYKHSKTGEEASRAERAANRRIATAHRKKMAMMQTLKDELYSQVK